MSGAEESVVCAQLNGIFAACACGLVLGVLYDVCWLLRQRRRGAGLTFLLDVLFSMACCAVLFVLSVGIFQQRMRGFLADCHGNRRHFLGIDRRARRAAVL